MKRLFILTAICLLFAFVNIQGKSSSTPFIYIDGNGVIRWSDTRQEASFFGVNYTLPFAHAYRALGYLGLDRKAAIDKDVYHITRLGLNAYRIHLWDVELTDEQGNLLENEHIDLMDYLIAKLKERNIHIVITAQTNFGNGYPERNIQTGGFSYKYDKCDMHSNPEAIAAQETYLRDLVKHTNPYTGLAYKDDPSIVGFEINNEPCHSGTKEEVKAGMDNGGTLVQNEDNAEKAGSTSDGKIDINTAAKNELMTLSGIGEAKADAIVRYREEHGAFQKIEDLMEVEGIKEGVFQKVKDQIKI